MTVPDLTRRSLLAVAAVGAATACTSDSPTVSPSPAPVDPDVALTAEAVARERSLVAAYRAETAGLPHLSVELTAIADHHLAHLRALGSTEEPLPSPGVPQRADGSAAAVAARRRLAALERTAAEAHVRGTAGASLRLAPLLATLAASESSHAAVL